LHNRTENDICVILHDLSYDLIL